MENDNDKVEQQSSQSTQQDWMMLSGDNIMNAIQNTQLNRSNTINLNLTSNGLLSTPSVFPPQPSLPSLTKQDSNLYLLPQNDDQSAWIQKGQSVLNLNTGSPSSQNSTTFMTPQQYNSFSTLLNSMQDHHQSTSLQMQQHATNEQQQQNISPSHINPYINTARNVSITNEPTTTTMTSTSPNGGDMVNLQGMDTSSPYGNPNTYEDEDDEPSTPPTPPVHNSRSLFEGTSFNSNITSPTTNNFSFLKLPTGNSFSTLFNINDQLQQHHLQQQYDSIGQGTSKQPKTEFYSVLQRGDTQLAQLHEHTTRLNSEGEIARQNSGQDPRIFIMKDYKTGTLPIEPDVYNSLLLRYNNRHKEFALARNKQIALTQHPDSALANELQRDYLTMKKDIEEENSHLKNLMSIRILEPADLKKIRETLEGIKSHLSIVEVMSQELKYIISGKKIECSVGLILTSQPNSHVLFRGGKGINEPFTVKLITGVTPPDTLSAITASIHKVSGVKKEKTTKENKEMVLENCEVELNEQTYEADFKNLKVNVSTRMTPSYLKFSCTYKHNNTVKTVFSYPSSPLVVITNESQWSEAAGKLLLTDAFEGNKDYVKWEYFANILHTHILKVTDLRPADREKLDIQNPRKLRSWEFDYIQKNYFQGKDTVSQQECKLFWEKFGPILQSIHFKRHVAALWHSGLIYGLISKYECNAHLTNLPEGSFLIRFSDSVPGSFAVAYVTNDDSDRVKHYLIKPDDIGANKSLPDFLKERYQFKTLYIVDPAARTLHPSPKDTAFESYYSKSKQKNQQSNPGYVQL